MAIERTFDVLELCCFPKGCLVPEDHQLVLATVFVPQLEAAGMKTAEWTRGALALEEPHLSKVKSIVCRQCNIFECQLNRRYKVSDGLGDLMYGWYIDRIEKGNQILAQLVPEAKKAELKQKGIGVVAFQMPSRKNPKLIFSFTRNERTRRVSCEIGKRRLQTDSGEETLLSIEQLGCKIEEAIRGLIVETALVFLDQTVGVHLRQG